MGKWTFDLPVGLLQRRTPIFFETQTDITRILKYAPPKLFGRYDELSEIDAVLSDPAIRVYSIIAFGGVGKTSLVARWLQRVAEDDWRGFVRVFAWSFYIQGIREDSAVTSDDFFAAAFKFFGEIDSEMAKLSPRDKGIKLGHIVRQHASLLVLDGLEPLQYPPGPFDGRLKDSAIEALLLTLAEPSMDPGLCIVTSRESVKELEGQIGTTRQKKLEFLQEKDGAALLHSLGVIKDGGASIKRDDPELMASSLELNGHALSLRLLGLYLTGAHGGNIRCRDQVDFFGQVDEVVSEVVQPYSYAFKVMAAYERWLLEGGEAGKRQLAVLRLLGLFDRPVDPGCLAALRSSHIEGLTDVLANLCAMEWNTVISDLERAGLLQTIEHRVPIIYGYDKSEATKHMQDHNYNLEKQVSFPVNTDSSIPSICLDAHPLIRQYFAQKLQNDISDPWKKGHSHLFEYLSNSVPFWPEGFDGIMILYQAIAHGCMGGHFNEAYKVYTKRILRGSSLPRYENYSLNLSALKYFFLTPWSSPHIELTPNEQAALLGSVSFLLMSTGQIKEAIQARHKQYEMAKQTKNNKEIISAISELVNLYLVNGNLLMAFNLAKEGKELSLLLDDVQKKIDMCVQLAVTQHRLGQLEESADNFSEAQRLQEIWHSEDNRQIPFLGYIQGARYWAFLLDRCSDNKELELNVCKQVEKAFKFQANTDADKGLYYLTKGRYRLALQQYAAAIYYMNLSVNLIKKCGRIDFMPRVLWARATLYRRTMQLSRAFKDTEEAMNVASRSEMRLYVAECHLLEGNLWADVERVTSSGTHENNKIIIPTANKKPIDSAQEAYKKAETIITDIGYILRQPELKLLLSRIKYYEGENEESHRLFKECIDLARAMGRNRLASDPWGIADEIGYMSDNNLI